MEVVILAADPGPELPAEWERRAGAAGLTLRLHRCETPADADAAVSRAIRQAAEGAGAFLEFRARDGLHYLRQSGIVFLRSRGHHAEIGLADGRVLRSKALRVPVLTVLQPYLEGGRFLQAARTAFVNMAYVNAVTREGVMLTSGQVFPITRDRYQALLAETGARGEPRRGAAAHGE